MREAWFNPASVSSGPDEASRPVKDGWGKMLAFLGRHLTKT